MKRILALLFPLLAGLCFGQTANFAIGNSVGPSGTTGFNLGQQDYYENFISKNLIYANPAMQGTETRLVIEVASGTTTSFTGQYVSATMPANYAVGFTAYVVCHGGSNSCAGGAQGCVSTVASNTAATYPTSGISGTFTTACGAALSQYDDVYLIDEVGKPTTSFTFNDFGWAPTGTGSIAADTTSGDLPPAVSGFQAKQCAKLSYPASGYEQLDTYFDTGAARNYNFNGTYTFTVQYAVQSGNPVSLNGYARRNGSDSDRLNVSWSGTLTSPGWQTFTTTFTAAEVSTDAESVDIGFYVYGASAGAVCFINATLTAAVDNNASTFRNGVIADMQATNQKEIRFHSTGQYGSSLYNQITPASVRQGSLSAANGSYTGGPYNELGLYDELVAAETAGMQTVDRVFPVTWRAADWANLADFLAGGSGTTYGAYRIALGHTAPFTSTIPHIKIEVGNEPWNTVTFPGASFNKYSDGGAYWNYNAIALAACTAFKASASYVAGVETCAAGYQTGDTNNVAVLQSLDPTHIVDRQAVNWYGLFSPTTCDLTSLMSAAYTEALAAFTNPTSNSGMYQSIATGLPVYGYEGQNSTNSGSCTPTQLTGIPEGEGYGVLDAMYADLAETYGGGTSWNIWQYLQPTQQINTTAGTFNINEWGIWTGPPGGPTHNYRPMVQAIALRNAASSFGYRAAVTSTNVPTYNFAALNGINAQNNVPYLWATAHTTGNGAYIVTIYNIDPTNAHAFTLSGTNAPAGTVLQSVFTSANMTDSNETTQNNMATTTTLTSFTSSTVVTLPAHSMMTLRNYTFTVNAGTVLGGLVFSGVVH